jgi:hypothetical protein
MREIKLGYECYVFTNWGLCRARVHKIIHSIDGVQYKVRIDIDSVNLGKNCNFYYTEDQLYSTVQEAKDAVEEEGMLVLNREKNEYV